jgi:hypothetical protein
MGAAGGAAIGSLLLPGVGTAIGGALGAYFGQKHATKKDIAVLDRFDRAAGLMWATVHDVQRSTWDHLIRALAETGEIALPDAAYFESAGSRWEQLKSTLVQGWSMENVVLVRQQIEGFIREFGPHPDALYLAGRTCVPPSTNDPAFSMRWASLHLQLFPQDPGAYENAADLALEEGDGLQALVIADRGLVVDATYQGLLNTRVEVLAFLGRYSEAESAMQGSLGADPHGPRLALIRGLMRVGRSMDAVNQVREWIHREGRPAAVARELASQPLTAPLVSDLNLRIADFEGVRAGLDGELQGIVQQYLEADGVISFLSELPPEKQKNSREAFLDLQSGEVLLFFLDWSLWQNAKTGLAITNRRVLWKCMWGAPSVICLRDITLQGVAAEKSVLYISGHSVDVEDEQVAARLADVLREACLTLKKGR